MRKTEWIEGSKWKSTVSPVRALIVGNPWPRTQFTFWSKISRTKLWFVGELDRREKARDGEG